MLCALAAVRAAQIPDVDLVVIASSDTELAPAIDEIRRLGTAKVETCCWWDAHANRGYRIHATDRTRPVWNTQLPEETFHACRDLTDYS